jgi:hypothetical protein
MQYENRRPAETSPFADRLPPSQVPTQRHSTGCFFLAAIAFVIGIIVGIGAILLFLLVISGNRSPLPVTTSPTSGNVTVHADSTVIASELQTSLRGAHIPGEISNIQVQFAQGDQITVTGVYQSKILNANVTHPLTIVLQPLVNNCRLQVHILKADFGNIPITGLAALFEDKINQQLKPKSNTLPSNIEYCIVNVRTDPTGLFATLKLVFPTASLSPAPSSTAQGL